MKVLDFFSGCGGTSFGFQQSGMEVILGLDSDHDAMSTFAANMPNAQTINADIREVPTTALSAAIADRSEPLVFSGCAPCQPFSRQRRPDANVDLRRTLLSEFGRFVEEWRPEYVFVENVPGMQKVGAEKGPLPDFLRLLADSGYEYDLGVVPALQYGVPQTRERLVIMASLIPGLRIPDGTHGPGKAPVSTVRDWLRGLPPLQAGETDPNDKEHVAAKLNPINLKRIKATPEGGGREAWPSDLWLDCHVNYSGHTDVYGRLWWDKPAAGLTTRCISYSNGRFGHPLENRAISVREAACLQTFPRNYKFSGSMISRARQVGNAVPPLMAQSIGNAILSHWAKSKMSD